MTNLLRVAANVLQDKMEQYAGEKVLYRREKDGEWKAILAIPGQRTTEQDTGSGLYVRGIVSSFIIRQTELAKAGFDPPRPIRQKDQIQFEGRVFTVASDNTEPHYQDTDPYGVAWRVSTTRESISAIRRCNRS